MFSLSLTLQAEQTQIHGRGRNTASNAANGSQTFSTAGLEDGVHAVYVRGVDTYGNYGAPKGAELKLDRTPPTQPDVTILPDAWTKENTASISWTNIADLNDLNRVEFSWDGGAYQATGLSEKTYADMKRTSRLLRTGCIP